MEVSLVATWLLLLLGLTAIGTPVAVMICRPFPRLGATLGLPVALAWLTLGTFWLGQLHYGVTTVVVVLLTLAGASALGMRYGPHVPRRPLLETLVLVGVAFLAMSWFRAMDPAVVPYAGEKFLDYSLLRAVLSAGRLPPVDPWFAGEPVRYYYGGQLLVGNLALLSGTSAPFAYNLGFATIFSITVIAAYGVGGAVATDALAPRRLGGLFAAGFVVLAGNLATIVRLIGWLLPGRTGERWAAWWHLGEGGLLDGPLSFFYWDASRVVPAPVEFFDYMINEFPMFSFVHGDLHAHVAAMPFVLLLVGVLGSWYRSDPEDRRYRIGLLAGGVPAIIGLLAFVNAWSVITATGLTAVTVATAPMVAGRRLEVMDADGRWRPRAVLRRAGIGASVAGGAVLLGAVLVLPFLLDLRAETTIGLLPHRTPLTSAILIYGGFLAVVIPGLVTRGQVPRRRAALGVLGVLVLSALAASVTLGTVVAFGGLVLVTAWLIFGRGDHTYAMVLVLAAAGLVVALEVVYVDDPSSWERLNTLFKLGLEAWILFGVAAGALLADLVGRRVPRSVGRSSLTTPGWTVAIVLVLVLGLYTGLAVGQHVVTAREDLTLDARVYIHEAHPDEAEAIDWLDARDGTPVLAEAPGTDIYRWVNAPSTFTPASSVAGWRHAANYQGASDAYFARVDQLTVVYEGTPEERAAVLNRHDVTYIYVGPTERSQYRLTLADDPYLSVAFENAAVTIYRVEA